MSVKDGKPFDEYKLLLTFENVEIKVFDMNPYLNKGLIIKGTDNGA